MILRQNKKIGYSSFMLSPLKQLALSELTGNVRGLIVLQVFFSSWRSSPRWFLFQHRLFAWVAEQIPSSSVSKRIKRATLNLVAGHCQLHSDTIISTLSDCSRRLSTHLNLMKAIQKRLGWRHRTYTLHHHQLYSVHFFPNSSFGYFRLDGGVLHLGTLTLRSPL